MFFEKIKRKAETGKDVVVIINEISQFAKSYNNLYLKSNTYSEISNVTAFRTKQLLSNAKNTDCGSITIIAVDKLRVPMNIENLFKFEILPLFDRVIIKPENEKNVSVSGLVLPDTAESKPQIGEVEAVGDGLTFDGEKTEMKVKVGDKVVYQKYAGDEIKIDGETRVVIRQIDIIGVLNG